jgi:ankyrin repeat protein
MIGSHTSRSCLTSIALALCVSVIVGATPIQSPVADAAMRSEVETVRTLLRQGADVSAAHGDGMTALHWAAERGEDGLANMLIAAGARLDATTRLGAYTALHLASRAGYADVVATLARAGSDIGARTTTGGATALHFASGAGSAEVVAVLLDHGADVNVVETSRGQTPLIFAASYGRAEVLRVLLAHGAEVATTTTVIDIEARDADDREDQRLRDRQVAAMQGLSVEVGGDQPPGRGQGGQASSSLAAGRGRPTAPAEPRREANDMEPLSYAGLVGTHGGLTALLHAAREGHGQAVFTLLDAGADINQRAADETSPMLMAMINGHFDLALRLFERGADPHLASAAGVTPLLAALNVHWAPKSRYPQQLAFQLQEATYLDVMERLLDAGADPNVRLTKHLWYMSFNFDLLRVDLTGVTPFWRAAYATDVAAMRLLVTYGADPSTATLKLAGRDRGGRGGGAADPSGLPPVPPGGPAVYPIHAASGVGYGEGYAANSHRHVPDGWLPAVTYLIEELGADVNARDHNGYTALHHAAARGDNDLILYLVSKGADVTAVSRRGQTTADMANGPVQRVSPFPETVKLLESLGSKNNHRCLSC